MAYYLSVDNLADIIDLSVMQQKPGSPTIHICKRVQGLGTFNTTSTMLPNIHILDMQCQTEQDLVLENDMMGDTVDINFHLQGNLDSQFRHLGRLEMRIGRHNLLFSPDVSRHEMGGGQQLSMFHISLQQSFFSEMIGCEDAWSEQMQNKLLRQEAFKALDHQPVVTPIMQQLIHSIQNHRWQGSIRMLQLQSKMYELLALQLEQFKMGKTTPGLSVADIEKLENVKRYLQLHFLEELSLTGLCRVAMLNEFKLKKGFKQLFGTTIFGYVKTLQMEYAGRLLKEKRKPVEEVAYALGYEHAQHFSTSFKKFWGSSPSGWGR